MNNLVTVIMSVYKEKAEWLKLAIESILNQTYQNLEFLIIIDDPNSEELKKIVYGYALMDKRIKIYENEKNKGLVYSLNRGLKVAAGSYIARMDADDISERDRIEKELLYLEKNNLDLVGSDFLAMDEASNILPGVASKMPASNRCITNILPYKSCLMHPTWLGKKELFARLSGYREIKFCEDYDFLLRAMLAGAKMGNVPEVLLRYRYNFKGISRSNKAEQRCISYFLSQNRKNLDSMNEMEINLYPSTEQGEKDIRKLERYFSISKLALHDKINGEYIQFLKKSLKILCMTYGRKSAYIILFTKLLIYMDRKINQ